MATQEKVRGRIRRHRRVRKKVIGTPDRPRLAVYRSNRHIYAQLIDDVSGRTLASASSLVDAADEDPMGRAQAVGKAVGDKAKAAGIEKAAFDRGGFKYHGQVRAVAEAARESGLEL